MPQHSPAGKSSNLQFVSTSHLEQSEVVRGKYMPCLALQKMFLRLSGSVCLGGSVSNDATGLGCFS